MKNSIICLAIISATFMVGSGGDFFYRSQEHALLARASEFHNACIVKDIGYLRRTLPTDFTVTHFDGTTFGKDQLIINIASRPDSVFVESFYLRHARVEINASQATVAGELVDSARLPDNSLVGHSFNSISVYEKRGDEWMLVSIRLSKL